MMDIPCSATVRVVNFRSTVFATLIAVGVVLCLPRIKAQSLSTSVYNITVGSHPPITMPVDCGGVHTAAGAALEGFAGGERLWSQPLQRYQPKALVCTDDENIIVAEDGISVRNARTGQLIWRAGINGQFALCAPVLSGSKIYVSARSGADIVELDKLTGKVLRTAHISVLQDREHVVTGLTVTKKGLIVVGTIIEGQGSPSHGFVSLVNLRTLRPVWFYVDSNLTGRRGVSDAATVYKGDLYLSDVLSNRLFSLRERNGSLAWSFDGRPGYSGFASRPKVIDSEVIAGSGDGSVYALARNGKLLWTAPVGSSIMDLQPCGNSIVIVAGDLLSLVHGSNVSDVVSILNGDRNDLFLAPIALEPDGLLIAGSATLAFISCRTAID